MTGLVESRMRGNSHVRFGRRPGETDPEQSGHRAPGRPHWAEGGETNAEHLIPACQHDHYGVHDAGWQVTRLDDGTVEWTAPTGHTYRVQPATYPIDTTSQHQAEGEDQKGYAPEANHRADPGPDVDQTDQGTSGPPETDEPPF